MKLSVERNHDPATQQTIPYHIRLEIVHATAEPGRVYNIPVHVSYVGVNKHFHVKICGVRIDAAKKPHHLLEPVENHCRRLINVSRFPSYVFIARRAGHVYPVYTINNEVFLTTTGGGPVFRHVELAKIRGYVTEYLHRIRVLGEDGKSDKLHARGVNPHTLGLRRPVFYLKKRVTGEDDFWAPVFESGDNQAIYAIAATARREVPINAGSEVLELHRLVAEVLFDDKRLTNRLDLRPDRLMPDYWSRLEPQLIHEGEVQVSGRHFPVYSTNNSRLWLGVEHRPQEDRYGLFFGTSVDDVMSRMVKDIARRDIKYD